MISYKLKDKEIYFIRNQTRIPEKNEIVTIDKTSYQVIGIHTKLKKEICYNDEPTLEKYEILLKEKK